MSENTQIDVSTTTEIVNVEVTETLLPVSLECFFSQSSSSNTVVNVSENILNVDLDITETQSQNVEIDFTYPAGPQGPQGPQGLAGSSLWGTIFGTLSAQTDLWKYLSAVGTSNFDIPTLTNYLSTNNILLCSLNVNGQILSAGIPLHNIFLTTETDSQTLSYIPSSYLLSISNGNTVNLSSINSVFAANSGKYENVYSSVQSNSAKWDATSTAVQQGSSNWYSASGSAISYTHQNFLPLSGGTIAGSLYVLSSVYVAGSAFYIQAQDLIVKDPIIYIAEDNQTDLLDIGIMASWTNPPGYPTGYQHGGLIRRSDNKTWTLFSGASSEPLSGLNVQWSQQGIVLEPLSAKFYGDIYGNRVVYGSLSASGSILGSNLNISNWNTAYTVATTYQSASSSFATNTALNAASSVLLPTSIYQSVSGNWQSTYITVCGISANWILDGGNTKGADITVGTNDAFALKLESNATTRIVLLSTGLVTIAGAISGLGNTSTSFNTGSATGNLSFAIGNARAYGQRAFAQGNNTIASGSNTAAFGSASRATGTTSFAKGTSTQATNTNSNAEGSSSIASGQASHAEGNSTTAGPGNNSHAEGLRTTASGAQAHTEGTDSRALGINSHAEGDNALAQGNRAHAEGLDTQALGDNSHAEGDTSQATNINAHAEGFETIASGQHSHSQNLRTQATGNMSHAGGRNSIAQGNISFVHGNQSIATGEKSFAIGETVHAQGSCSIAMGVCAIAAHDNSYIWTSENFSPSATIPISTTRVGQYMVSASGGVFIPGRVGIGTDNNSNALTVVGTISTLNHGNSQLWNTTYETAITSVNNFTGKDITLNNYILTTTSQNVSSNRKYAFDTTVTTLTATLPSSPNTGDEIEFFDIYGTWSTRPLVVANNTRRIEFQLDELLCNVQFGLIKLVYTNNTIGWRIIPLPKHNVPSVEVITILAPIPVISASALSGTTPFTVTLTGFNTLPVILSPVTNWFWNLTGGNTAQFTTSAVTYTYNTAGTYTINLTASNSSGAGTTSRLLTAVTVTTPTTSLSTDPFSEYVTLLLTFEP